MLQSHGIRDVDCARIVQQMSTSTEEGIRHDAELRDQPLSLCLHFSVRVLGLLPPSCKQALDTDMHTWIDKAENNDKREKANDSGT